MESLEESKEQLFDKNKSILKYDIFRNPIGQTGNCYHFISSLKKILKHGLIELWEGQRSLDIERAKTMAEYFHSEYLKHKTIKLRGSILLCKKDDLLFSNIFYLIDGQHRYYALKSLLESNLIPDIEIRIDIIVVKDEDEIRQEFININKSVPVPIHYLTPNDIVNLCFNNLRNKFPKAFSEGKCNRPAINSDQFKDAFLEDDSQLLNKLKVDDADKLYKIVMKLNDHYKKMGVEKLQEMLGRKNKAERQTIANCYEKCKKGDYLFLGLFKGTGWTTDLK